MKKGALYKTIRVFAVLLVAVAIAVTLVILRPKAKRQVPVEKGRLVEVLPARAEDVQMIVESFGTVVPRELLKLVAQVPGAIVEISPAFKEGSFIKKGTRLIQIDQRTYGLEVKRRSVQIKQSEAELKRLKQELVNLQSRVKIAKSDATLAENEYLRLKKLIQRNVIAQSQLDKSEQAYLASLERLQALENQMALIAPQKEQLIAARDMAEVMHEQAKLDLERSGIDAAFDGWVLEKSIEVGQHVTVGQQLGSIYRSGKLDIEVRIPAKDFKWFPAGLGQDTAVAADVLYENAGQNYTWSGHVARVMAVMDERTRTLPMVIEVDELVIDEEKKNYFRLRPGMFVTIKIKGKEIQEAFVVPRYVVYPGDVVYTVKDNHLRIKEVNILRSYKDLVIIDEGLTEGELIVKTPLSSVKDGMRVRLTSGD
ncbi:MAG: efflux RND transporter periplasmic adaptor subunit [Desulfobacteraceae bacterium]|jgi:RND family efflux transporter MFP subunit|nr:efflux RND transporter periplasmic adaptor subunit [Desulfobacteraceae bacterium]